MVEYQWNEELSRLYADRMRPVVKRDHRPWAKKIAARISDKRNLTLIDIASGPGFLLLELSKLLVSPQLIAQDATSHMLRIAREEGERFSIEIETVESPAERIGIGDNSADVVTCKQLFHEANDVRKVILEMQRILKPGGKAFVIDFDADGSVLTATLIRVFLKVTAGREISSSFWKSFRSGLRGQDVKEMMQGARFRDVIYEKHGPNYMIVGQK